MRSNATQGARPKRFSRLPLVLGVLLLLTASAWAGPDPEQDDISRQYEQAKAYYQDVASGAGKDRNRWLTSVTAFRSIYKAAPTHQVAPKSLFMLGKIHQAMYQQSGKAKDLDQAIASYEELAAKYAGNFLADDAFFLLGSIYLAEKKDPAKAAKAYTKIIAIYPEGDMAAAAEEQLLQIKQGIAAPLLRARPRQRRGKNASPRRLPTSRRQMTLPQKNRGWPRCCPSATGPTTATPA